MSRISEYFKSIGGPETNDPFVKNEARANVNMALLMFVMSIISVLVIILTSCQVFDLPFSGILFIGGGTLLILGPSVSAVATKGKGSIIKYVLLIEYLVYASFMKAYLGEFGTLLIVIGVLMSARYFERKFTLVVIGVALVAFCASQCGYAFAATPNPDIGGDTVKVVLDSATGEYHFSVVAGKEWEYFLYVWQYNGLPNLIVFAFSCVVTYTFTLAGRKLVNDKAEQLAKEATMHGELVMAQEIQKSMLPKSFPLFPQYEDINVYATMRAAKEVGGDFYDAFTVDDDHVAFLIADVSGKGIPAAMFMALAKAIIKTQTISTIDPGETFKMVNNSLREGNDVNFFVTAWIGVMNTKTAELKYVNAGHNPPLLARKNNRYEYLKDISGPVLTAIPDYKYKVFSLKLQKGDRLFLYTDGVTEAENSNHEQYGAKRLKEFLTSARRSSIRSLVKGVGASVEEFVNGYPQSDDLTILMFEYGAFSKSFVANEESIPAIISTCDRYLQKYGADERTVRQFDIVLDEALANVCHYAYEPGVKGNVNVSIYYDDSNRDFTLVLSDKGKEFNPLAKEDPDTTLKSEERQIGGLGIYMVKKLVDKIDYYRFDGENILVMSKKI